MNEHTLAELVVKALERRHPGPIWRWTAGSQMSFWTSSAHPDVIRCSIDTKSGRTKVSFSAPAIEHELLLSDGPGWGVRVAIRLGRGTRTLMLKDFGAKVVDQAVADAVGSTLMQSHHFFDDLAWAQWEGDDIVVLFEGEVSNPERHIAEAEALHAAFVGASDLLYARKSVGAVADRIDQATLDDLSAACEAFGGLAEAVGPRAVARVTLEGHLDGALDGQCTVHGDRVEAELGLPPALGRLHLRPEEGLVGWLQSLREDKLGHEPLDDAYVTLFDGASHAALARAQAARLVRLASFGLRLQLERGRLRVSLRNVEARQRPAVLSDVLELWRAAGAHLLEAA